MQTDIKQLQEEILTKDNKKLQEDERTAGYVKENQGLEQKIKQVKQQIQSSNEMIQT